jgi:hypothetical protein
MNVNGINSLIMKKKILFKLLLMKIILGIRNTTIKERRKNKWGGIKLFFLTRFSH